MAITAVLLPIGIMSADRLYSNSATGDRRCGVLRSEFE